MSNRHLPWRRTGLALAGLAAATALVLSGCSAPEPEPTTSAEAGERGDLLTLAATVPPVSLDPVLQSVNPANNWYINLAYDPLIRADAETGELLPDLATEWAYLDDENLTFELKLREGVVFSDGDELTAEAVADSLNYAIESGVNGPNWLSSVESIEATDELTVLITNSEPNDSLPFLLCQRLLMGSIISPTGLEDKEGLKTDSHGVGPYILDSAATIANDTYVFVPNDTYWDQSKIHWNRVEIKVVANTAAALQAVASGAADIFRSDAPTAIAAVDQGIPVETVDFGLFGVVLGDRDGEITPAMADPLVRQALSYAIDREGITTAVYGDLAVPNATLSVPGYAGYTEDDAAEFAYDPDKAIELLEEAGYEDGFSFEMATGTAGNANLMAQAMVENWAAIGVTVNLTSYTDETQLVTDVLATNKYSANVYAYGALPQYIQSKSFFTGGASQFNPFDTQDDEMFGLWADAALAVGEDAQSAAYEAAVRYAAIDQAWVINVFSTSLPIVHSDRLTGVGITSPVPTPDVAWTVRLAD